jgi:hypothetical protein
VRTGANEFYLAGANVALDFQHRPQPDDARPFVTLQSRQANQLNFLTVEEGHFEHADSVGAMALTDDVWVTDFYRNGDEANFELYVRDGEIVRLRLNPNIGIAMEG